MRSIAASILLVMTLSVGATIAWSPASAISPDERLDDPELEARARTLQREIRCVVCQNESIDSSQAGIARDLRIIVRERIAQGDSDEEVKQFLVARYGDYVLFRPPMRPDTWPLWFGPAVVLILGGVGVILYLRRRRPRIGEDGDAGEPAAGNLGLTEEERRRLARILGDETER